MTESDALETQIKDARRSISSEGYPMSIGELTNMYRDGELIIRPEFQRFYRWSNLQKSRLVESVILGIPLPSIFVAQTDKGLWEVVDGLQRISTLLELQGELKDKSDKKLPQLNLQKTKYLPALEGRTWDGPNPSTSLSSAQRMDIKRSKVDIKIIKRESSAETKFDLFQRLNNYGTRLTSQELRSALLVAVSPDFFAWIEHLASYDNFVNCVTLNERLIEERFDLELVTRFIVLHNFPTEKINLSSLRDLPQILDDRILEMASSPSFNSTHLENVFKKTFDKVADNGGDVIFRRWDKYKNEFKGSFLLSSFEIFALGLGFHIANGNLYRTDLVNATKELWSMDNMQKGFSTGRSTEARLAEFIPLGRKITAATIKW
jgi:hypothetical protein